MPGPWGSIKHMIDSQAAVCHTLVPTHKCPPVWPMTCSGAFVLPLLSVSAVSTAQQRLLRSISHC